MTRLEGGALHLNTVQCDVQDVIRIGQRDQLGEAARQRQITVDVAAELPLVPLDFVLIVQVVANLLDNALKYSENLAPIQVEAQIAEDQLQVRISIAERGFGRMISSAYSISFTAKRRRDRPEQGWAFPFAKDL